VYRDSKAGTIWCYCERSVFQYQIKRESRDAWRIYMDQGKFSLARQYADADPVALDAISCKEADDLFAAGKLEASAALYADTRRPFEEVALKFMDEDRRKALRVYLRNKLDGLNAMEKPQRVMLVTWLLELELNALGELRDSVGEQSGTKEEEELIAAKNRVRDLLGLPHVKVCSDFQSIVLVRFQCNQFQSAQLRVIFHVERVKLSCLSSKIK
jgi:hypothetical protein